MGNMLRKFGEDWTCGNGDMRADRPYRQTDRQTDMPLTIFRSYAGARRITNLMRKLRVKQPVILLHSIYGHSVNKHNIFLRLTTGSHRTQL